jgi:hypothetical protein
MTTLQTSKKLIGWREWMSLPVLGIQHIKVKVDTGARTSALHAFYVEPYENDGADWVKFSMHPLQGNTDFVVDCYAPVKDRRIVSDSGGHREERFVIETVMQLGDYQWNAELTLTDRDSMKFRMLLGRTAIEDHFIIDPSLSYAIGKKPRINKLKG